MPGIPLVVRETTYSRGADQMCRQDSDLNLSAEEEEAAEESFSVYCKPVELYNILQRRAIINPLFIQRCLHYKIQAKHKTRILMTISLSATLDNGLLNQNLFPVRILLARPVSNLAVTEHSAVYRFSKECILTSYTDLEGIINGAQAKFILPEFKKLTADIKAGSLTILFVSCVESASSVNGIEQASNHTRNGDGYCLLGKIPMELLYFSWEKSPNLSLGDRAEMLSTIDMDPCFAKFSCSNEEKSISIQIPCNVESVSKSQQVAVIISGEEVGVKEESEDNLCSYNSIPTSSFHRVSRLRAGHVIFNFWYYGNKMQRTEVAEDFSCAFCLVKCASFKGLKLHLSSSHDLFSYEFLVNEEYRAVNVSVRTDICYSEVVVADKIDPKEQTFYFCSKRFRRRKAKRLHQSPKHEITLVLPSVIPVSKVQLPDKTTDESTEHETSSPNITGISNATAQSCAAEPECAQSLAIPAATNLFAPPPPMLQFAKSRKLSVEQSEPRTRALLQRRNFFHSHRAQPMALGQVLSDQDSEDEVDDDVADLEDRRMLDDFVDVTKDEKRIMHLWNSFVRKQRVLADTHIPWACKAFSRLHGQYFTRTPSLLWCWRLYMIKLWNHGLLDSRTMNNCNIVLEQIDNPTANQQESGSFAKQI